jgi:Serine dehydrogenase proteinase
MPSWGEIAQEIIAVDPAQLTAGASPLDFIRRKYLVGMYALTGRATILYATKWTIPAPGSSPGMLSIGPNDVHGFMEAVYGLTGPNLDLILHSPGGSPEAAEAIVLYLRSKFDNIRVIVPLMAMSAATMIACAADEIIMGNHSFIGPIDPQLQLQTALSGRLVPAQAIIDQFEMAKSQTADPTQLRAWLPMLSQYGPDLLVTCSNATNLAKKLVREWLTSFMFNGAPDAAQRAESVAEWLADHNHFMTHGRPISRHTAEEKGLKIVRLEDDQALQDAVLSVYHATSHTFGMTGAVKMIENHLGKAFLDVQQMMIVGNPPQPVQPH